MRIALIDDINSKLPNLALMKISTYHKQRGDEVLLNPPSPAGIDKTYVSIIFTKNRDAAVDRYRNWPDPAFGGTGYDLTTTLPASIESQRPDYDLYSMEFIYDRIKQRISKKENSIRKAEEIVTAGIGFLSRGCVNTAKTCPWCAVPVKEGKLRRVSSLEEIINPRSNRLILLDNSPLASPDALDVLREMADRKLVVDITQGFDIRRLTPELAQALAKVRHWRSLHYAWDAVRGQQAVFNGINMLSEFVAKSRQLCYVLCGFNTTFDEDMERVRKLHEAKIRPYIMVYQPLHGFKEPSPKDQFERTRLAHFARWVNAPAAIYKTTPFTEYTNWINAQAKLPTQQLALFS
jgi:hypothetical protein